MQHKKGTTGKKEGRTVIHAEMQWEPSLVSIPQYSTFHKLNLPLSDFQRLFCRTVVSPDTQFESYRLNRSAKGMSASFGLLAAICNSIPFAMPSVVIYTVHLSFTRYFFYTFTWFPLPFLLSLNVVWPIILASAARLYCSKGNGMHISVALFTPSLFYYCISASIQEIYNGISFLPVGSFHRTIGQSFLKAKS